MLLKKTEGEPKAEDEGMLSLQQQVLEMQKLMQMQMKTMQAQAQLLASNQSPNIPHSEPATDSQIVRNVKSAGRALFDEYCRISYIPEGLLRLQKID